MRTRSGILVVTVTVLGACSSGPAVEDVNGLERLCQAQEATTTDEVRELFEGPTHQALHDLADDLQRADVRPVAGDVLEAKQAVEAALASDPVPDDLDDRLNFLIEVTGRGLAVLERPALACAP